MQTFVFVPPDAMSAIGAWPPVSRQPGRQAEDGLQLEGLEPRVEWRLRAWFEKLRQPTFKGR